jgi:hypothetical protein
MAASVSSVTTVTKYPGSCHNCHKVSSRYSAVQTLPICDSHFLSVISSRNRRICWGYALFPRSSEKPRVAFACFPNGLRIPIPYYVLLNDRRTLSSIAALHRLQTSPYCSEAVPRPRPGVTDLVASRSIEILLGLTSSLQCRTREDPLTGIGPASASRAGHCQILTVTSSPPLTSLSINDTLRRDTTPEPLIDVEPPELVLRR